MFQQEPDDYFSSQVYIDHPSGSIGVTFRTKNLFDFGLLENFFWVKISSNDRRFVDDANSWSVTPVLYAQLDLIHIS